MISGATNPYVVETKTAIIMLAVKNKVLQDFSRIIILGLKPLEYFRFTFSLSPNPATEELIINCTGRLKRVSGSYILNVLGEKVFYF